jgi:hypothetical protein
MSLPSSHCDKDLRLSVRRVHDTRQIGISQTVEAIYERLAPVYDLIYGVTLDHGRRHAMTRLAPSWGESILEIGVGTGLSAVQYPRRLTGRQASRLWNLDQPSCDAILAALIQDQFLSRTVDGSYVMATASPRFLPDRPRVHRAHHAD